MRHLGEIPAVPVDSTFASRAELSAAGGHRPLIAGISGAALEGADSIVLNGGYADDEDIWDEIIYTGLGGNTVETKRQVADRALAAANLALAESYIAGLPVRVTRGSREPSGHGPVAGYRYDGLYAVDRYWSAMGRSAFRVWRFPLVRLNRTPPRMPPPGHAPGSSGGPCASGEPVGRWTRRRVSASLTQRRAGGVLMRDLNTRDWDLNQVQPGMEVCDRNGVKVGAVAHVYRDPVLEAESAVGQESASKRMVEVKTGLLGLGKHLFVPMNGIQAVTSESVVLSRSREEFDQMGWASRPASLAEPH